MYTFNVETYNYINGTNLVTLQNKQNYLVPNLTQALITWTDNGDLVKPLIQICSLDKIMII